jgi:succinoglycan biosynthesis transport protein ExoP
VSNSFLTVLQRRRVAVVVTLLIAVVALPFIFVNLKPTYVATSHVLMVGNGNGANGSMMPSSDMSTLTTSETVVKRVAKRFSLGHDMSAVLARIDAKSVSRSNVMPISFRDKDPKLARVVTNALAEETVTYYKELSGGQFNQMVSYLTGSAEDLKQRIRSIDITLQTAAQKDSYVGSDTALETITARINDLQTQRAVAYAALVSDEAIADARSAQPREIDGIVNQEVLAGDPYVQALRSGQARDAAQLQFQRAQFTERYPGLPGLADQVMHETGVLAAAENSALAGSPSASASYAATILAKRNAMAVAAGDRAKVSAIDGEIAAQEGYLRDLPGTGSTVNLLRVEREAAKASYDATTARLTETRANQAAVSSLGSLVVIDRAVDAAPRIPRLAMDVIVAFILLALTVGVAYVLDALDPGLRSPESVEKLYGIPIIGNLGKR